MMILVFFEDGGHLAFDPREWSVNAIMELLEGRTISEIKFLQTEEEIAMVA